MIYITSSRQSKLSVSLVTAALIRSCSFGQVQFLTINLVDSIRAGIFVFISPSEEIGEVLIKKFKDSKCKIIVFGKLPSNVRKYFGFKSGHCDNLEIHAKSSRAKANQNAESAAEIVYSKLNNIFDLLDWVRPFERFDFADEWNNLGYGAIRFDGSIWSLSQLIKAPVDNEISEVRISGKRVSSYSANFNNQNSSLLWMNREVGSIDSFEWVLVEGFISSWRAAELPCNPVISEIPSGYDSAVTMRMDCDEGVESARFLMDSYLKRDIPFSLAVTTSNLADKTNHSIVQEVNSHGGSILSHTSTHAANWGGSYMAALKEAVESSEHIRGITGEAPRYAVSPFHQTPHYALKALADAGYSGCIGGIIKNNPEFMMARGGFCSGISRGFVGHSQQVMLHGDCLLDPSMHDPLEIYKKSYDLAYKSGSLFGYLDHPFSDRYQYGWKDEEQRIFAHQNFIDHIYSRCPRVIFMSENDALDFLRTKDSIGIFNDDEGYSVRYMHEKYTQHSLSIKYHSRLVKINDINGSQL